MQIAKHLTTAFRAFILSLALWAISPIVWATSTDTVIDVGDGKTRYGINWIYYPNANEFYVSGDVTITGKTKVNHISMQPGATAAITLADVDIDVSSSSTHSSGCAFSMGGRDVSVRLTLIGINVLKSGDTQAGIGMSNNSKLTIDGTGSLTVIGDAYGAGIGGGIDGWQTTTINGGTINAIGGNSGAGIGGRHGSFITISGGTVNAQGGAYSAGIGGEGGGNDAGSGGIITISGGVVNAKGGLFGAGIGGGGPARDGSPGGGGIITIVGNAQVTAVGGSDAQGAGGAGIGSSGSVMENAPTNTGRIIINTTGKVEATGGIGMVDSQGIHHDGANIGGGGYLGGSGNAIVPGNDIVFQCITVIQNAGGTIMPLGGSTIAISDKASDQSQVECDAPQPTSSGSSGRAIQPRILHRAQSTNSDEGQQRAKVTEGMLLSSPKKAITATEGAPYRQTNAAGGVAQGVTSASTKVADGQTVLQYAVPKYANETFILTPDPDYLLASVEVNGKKSYSGSIQTLSAIGNHQIITATFALRPISSGSTINVSDSLTTSGTGWTYSKRDRLFIVTGDVTITGTTSHNGIRVVSGDAIRNITLADASIDVNYCAFDISGATVFLTLNGTNELKSYNSAGLRVTVGSILTIDGTGSLTAIGGSYGAGIGSAVSNDGFVGGGDITINSGTITAEGGNSSAGIGGGFASAGGNVTINGGTISVRGGTGIGSGWERKNESGENTVVTYGGGMIIGGKVVPKEDLGGGNITISGGAVTATGFGLEGAGIGGQAGSNIVISGGTVKAKGDRSAGISTGYGKGKKEGSVTITGDADVTAIGGEGSPPYIGLYGIELGFNGGHAGIGSPGTRSNLQIPVGKITINTTGTVKATGGSGVGKFGFHHDGANIGQGGSNLGSGFSTMPQKTVTTHSVTVTQTSGGTIAPLGGAANAVPHGANKTFTITPEPGYAIASVTVDGADVGAVRSWTLVNVADDKRAITATFVPKTAPVENEER